LIKDYEKEVKEKNPVLSRGKSRKNPAGRSAGKNHFIT
jgi:hypothetical protein